MPRNASGVYTLPAGNPVVPGTTIDAAWANDTLEDLANEVTNSLSRTGAGGMLAPFRLADGNVTAPGIAWLNETNSGLYRSGAGSTWMSILGVNTAQFSTVGLTIPFGKALTAQGNASVGGTLSVTGAVIHSSSLAVGGVLTATGGVVGNVTGNVTAGSGTSTFNDLVVTGSLDMTAGSSATITGLSTPTNASDAANKGYVDTQVATRLALTGGTMFGPIAMNGFRITGMGDPLADQDAATKAYVDSVAQGLDAKASCQLATTANITLSGVQTVDGVSADTNDRVLVKNQSNAAENGIYVVNLFGAWARASDANTWNELVAAYTFVEKGATNANNGYVCTIQQGGTLGTTPVTWAQFSGAGQIDAGAGLTKTGNTLAVGTASSSRIVVNADNIDLATTGVTANTYRSVTVDAYGRVTAGTNPTTLAGYGITDAYTTTQVDNALALKLNLSGGTMSGALAMGTNKITGLGDPTNPQDAATKTYIDTIFGSTTTAAASAAAAAASASAAATSATNAANSATSAAGSATSAASSYTTFNNQYLGSKASDPSTNNTGGALVAGNLYWNSTVNEMRVYSGSAWLAAYLPATGYLALTGGTLTGNLGFNGTGLTIRGDMSNATASSRLSFQSSTTNGATIVSAKPNGTSTASYMQVFNAADVDNASYGYMGVAGTAVSFMSNKTGTGTALPMTFSTNGVERFRVHETTGNLLINGSTDNGTDKLQVTGSMSLSSALRVGASPSAGTAGQALLSGGAGAAPTWGTLSVAAGGTGATTLATGGYLKGNGTSAITSQTGIPATDITSGTLATARGGTGLASFTSGGAVYATSTSALTTGTLPVSSGGTGATSLTANNVLLGNGTSAVQTVAPGASGNVLVSNGTTWTSAAPAGGVLTGEIVVTSRALSAPDYLPANGAIYAQSSYSALYAQVGLIYDGIVWVTRNSQFGSTHINTVAFGGGYFIAVGEQGTLSTSFDGLSWTARTSGFGTTTIRGAASNGSVLVAVGDTGTLTSSSDGITWTVRTSTFGTTDINAVAFGNGLFVAVGGSGKIATSSDGITWTSRTSPGSASLQGIIYANGQFVAVGSGGAVYTSTNGTSGWTSRSFGASVTLRSVAYGNGLYVAVTDGGANNIGTSPDGITWTRQTSPFANAVSLLGVTYGGNLFVAVGIDNSGSPAKSLITVSEDGVNWQIRSTNLSVSLNSVTFGANCFVLAGNSGTLQRHERDYNTFSDFKVPLVQSYPGALAFVKT